MQTFTLSLTADQAQLVWNAVMELPGKQSYPLLKNLEQQLAAQGAFGPVATPDAQMALPDIPEGA